MIYSLFTNQILFVQIIDGVLSGEGLLGSERYCRWGIIWSELFFVHRCL